MVAASGLPAKQIPGPDGAVGWHVLKTWVKQGYILAALEALHAELGDVFRMPLPGFDAVFLVGPEANKFVLTESRHNFLWRSEQDPVTLLLRHGVLVEDGAAHDNLRQTMNPALHRTMFDGYIDTMVQYTDLVTQEWQAGVRIDLLTAMRRLALLILTDTLFKADFRQDMQPLWHAIQQTLKYISPGLWLAWPGLPRLGYQRAIQQMNGYFDRLIARRRAQLGEPTDVLGLLIAAEMSEALIRDQLLTMFIAGHDTSTALLGWTLALLARHPDVLARAQQEIDQVVGQATPTYGHIKQLSYLDRVIKETLRLYPPIHLGSRIAAVDIHFQGYRIPAGSRVLYSIYLTQRHQEYWPDPARFDPERFAATGVQHPPYAYLPFGGGPRNCIGATFAQVEAKVVLARILQRYDLVTQSGALRPQMHATLEPPANARIEVQPRGSRAH